MPTLFRLLSNFWERRVRRLFAALAVMLAGTAIAANFVYLSDNYQSMTEQMQSVLLIKANYHYRAALSSYFAANDTEVPFLHCWSLAVEEQFYVFYPVAVGLAWQVPALQQPWLVVLSLSVVFWVSLYTSVIQTEEDPTYAFYMLPCRAWEMAMGGLLCFDFRWLSPVSCSWGRKYSERLGWLGLFLIASSFFAFTIETPYPSYNALLPTVGTAIFIASQRSSLTSAGEVMSLSLIVYIGKISYPLYLWHWPIYVLLAYSDVDNSLDFNTATGGVILAIVMAHFSYVFVEPIFNKKKAHAKPPSHQDDGSAFSSVQIHRNDESIKFNTSSIEMANLGLEEEQRDLIGVEEKGLIVVEENNAKKNTDFQLVFLLVVYICLLAFTVFATNNRIGGIFLGPVDRTSMTLSCHPNKASYSTEECVPFLNGARIDEFFDVDAGNISMTKILASPGWGAQGKFNLAPYPVGPVDDDGVHRPTIAYVGSSKCLQHAPVLDALHDEYAIAGVFICRIGHVAPFGKKKYMWSKAWDMERRAIFAQLGKVDLIVWFGFFSGKVYRAPDYDYAQDFRTFLNLTDKLLVVGDVPLISVISGQNGQDKLKIYAHQQFHHEGNWDFIKTIKEAPLSKRKLHEDRVKALASSSEFSSRVRFTEIASYFTNERTGGMHLVNPCSGMLTYKDSAHLNVEGNQMLEQFYRKSIFGQHYCSK
jgi:peptidoglycan/LPS O-acetylase OafA/YrhL